MYIANRKIALAYKIMAIVVCLWGQLLAMGLFNGTFSLNKYFYYTQQSNVLCLAYFVLAAIYCAKEIKSSGAKGPATFAPRFKGAVVLAITVTMLIYWALLHSPGHPSINTTETFITHLFVPLFTIFDWILFDKKGNYKKLDPLIWLVIPLVYYGFSLIVAQTGKTFYGGSRYPYFFIDSDLLGWGGVGLYVAALLAIFAAIGYLFYGADRLLAKLASKQAHP